MTALLAPMFAVRGAGYFTTGSLTTDLILTAGTLLVSMPAGLPAGTDARFLAERETMVHYAAAIDKEVLRGRTVLAEHGLQFAFTVATGVPARTAGRSETAVVSWLVRVRNTAVAFPPGSERVGPFALIPGEAMNSWLSNLEPGTRDVIMRLNRQHLAFSELSQVAAAPRVEAQ